MTVSELAEALKKIRHRKAEVNLHVSTDDGTILVELESLELREVLPPTCNTCKRQEPSRMELFLEGSQ